MLPLAVPLALPIQTVDLAGGIRIEFGQAERREDGTALFSQGVSAVFDGGRMTAETVELDEARRAGSASGGVRVDHEEGWITAESLAFSWGGADLDSVPGLRGRARSGRVQAGRLAARAEVLEVYSGRYVLTNAWFSPTSEADPKAGFTARRLTIRPGVEAVAEGLGISAWGASLTAAPAWVFPLSDEARAIEPPAPFYDSRRGFGAGWRGGFGSRRPWEAEAEASFSQRGLPGYRAAAAYSLLSPDRKPLPLFPRSDLDGFESGGWLDGIGDRPPGLKGRQLMEAERRSIFVQTQWNASPAGAPDFRDQASKQWEAGLAEARRAGPGRIEASLRGQSIRSGSSDPWRERILGIVSYNSDAFPISPQASLFTRLDGAWADGAEGSWSRTRATLGLQLDARPGVRLGLGWVGSASSGEGAFPWERSAAGASVHYRADLRQGPYSFSLLNKHSAGGFDLLERQWEASFLADAFEPFFRFNSNGGGLSFGVRLRLGESPARLAEDEPSRTKG